MQVPEPGLQIEDWWKSSLRNLPKDERRVAAALLVYMAWNLWKERNRGIFEGVSVLDTHIFVFIKEIGLRQAALRVHGVP